MFGVAAAYRLLRLKPIAEVGRPFALTNGASEEFFLFQVSSLAFVDQDYFNSAQYEGFHYQHPEIPFQENVRL